MNESEQTATERINNPEIRICIRGGVLRAHTSEQHLEIFLRSWCYAVVGLQIHIVIVKAGELPVLRWRVPYTQIAI